MSIFDVFTAIFTGAGLAMDAFAVSVADGISCRHLRVSSAIRAGLFLAFFSF